ncbi:MAG TPA: ABC transporter ATP-binding protein [Gemmatimonadaceae bacterium]|nr:ABC transporter ATP-binding protein [Gemmatimonadaceae bacterium]
MLRSRARCERGTPFGRGRRSAAERRAESMTIAVETRYEPPRRVAADAPRGAPVFVARGLTKIYRTGDLAVHALRALDLDLYRGELLVILGASGSGKSTLLNILGGLDTATGGTVMFEDHDLTRYEERSLTRYRREHVGFVFQFYNLIPSLTARENVALVTEIAENPMSPEEALALVGLGERLDHFPAQLSGGEQQRVAIARAVAKRPDVLLCDEPTGALDVETGRLVLNTIDRVNRETGAATALITHNVAIAAMADRVLRMTSGRISEEHRNARRVSPEELSW